MIQLESNREDPPNSSLIPGRDYPRSEQEFGSMFADTSACIAYLESLRWHNRFICSSCSWKSKPWRQSRGRLVCPRCRHQSSVTAGTFLNKTRIPLLIWLKYVWYISQQEASFDYKLTLNKWLGVPKRSIPGIQNRLSMAMACADRTQLQGRIYVGPNPDGEDKSYLAIELADRPMVARVRAIPIKGQLHESILLGIRESIAPGSTLFIEGKVHSEKLMSYGYSQYEFIDNHSSNIFAEILQQVDKIKSVLWFKYKIASNIDMAIYLFNRRSITLPQLLFRTLVQDLLAPQQKIGQVING